MEKIVLNYHVNIVAMQIINQMIVLNVAFVKNLLTTVILVHQENVIIVKLLVITLKYVPSCCARIVENKDMYLLNAQTKYVKFANKKVITVVFAKMRIASFVKLKAIHNFQINVLTLCTTIKHNNK